MLNGHRLANLTTAFTLSGLPSTTQELNGAVTMTVITDNPNGYTVTAQAAGPALLPLSSGLGDTIPIGELQAREHGATSFNPLSATSALLLHSQQTPSGAGGDAVGDDFQVTIPSVTSGSYGVALDYVAMTN